MLGASLLFTSAAVPATTSPPPDPADAYYIAGDFDGAVAAYAAEMQENPADAHARLRLAALRLYEDDLDGASALLAEPATANASAPGVQTLLDEIARRRSESAKRTAIDGGQSSVPFIAVDPLPTLHVRADGVDAVFLIDTGAPDIVLDPDFARELGLAVTSAGIGIFAGGKRAAVSRTVVPRLDVGTAHAYAVSAAVLPTRAMRLLPNERIDGILGTGFFERFLATIDYPRARLILQPRNADVSQRFQSAARAAGATIVPCWLVGDHFVLARARIGVAPEGLFLFDSGLAGGGFMPSTALIAAAHLKPDTAHASTGVGGGGPVQVVPVVAPSIAVGGAVQNDVPGSYTPQGSPLGIFPFTVDGMISHLFLEHYAYTVDFTSMRIVLQPEP